ncbi:MULTISPECIES: Uma2 family endonuclease [Nostoc]|uniref:Uma2 family endonuclease n=1 Tax=Nostoc TaxID=1177 RepID=UPI001F556032|nr:MULTISPECIES: Uma2 family endonuclease [Nostoc]
MSQTTSKVRWTIQDVAALPDNEWIRYEILDGELFAVRSPHHKHQHAIGCIFLTSSLRKQSDYRLRELESQKP